MSVRLYITHHGGRFDVTTETPLNMMHSVDSFMMRIPYHSEGDAFINVASLFTPDLDVMQTDIVRHILDILPDLRIREDESKRPLFIFSDQELVFLKLHTQ